MGKALSFIRFLLFFAVLFIGDKAFSLEAITEPSYSCTPVTYVSCNDGYYLSDCDNIDTNGNGTPDYSDSKQSLTISSPASGNTCNTCPDNHTCAGDVACPVLQQVTCEPGYYLPANKLVCEKCPAGKYCAGGSFNYPVSSSDRGITGTCPSPTTRVRTTYPTKYYGTPTLVNVAHPTYYTGVSSIEGCVVTYVYDGSRGRFYHAAVKYNTTSDKYDNDTGADFYYSRPAAGYYLNERYSDTYCNNGASMLYRDALPCPAGKYCLGRTTDVACSSGTYETTLGIDGQVTAGYYSTSGATKAAPTASDCVAGGTCGTIAAGYWGAAGATTSTGSGKVNAGYYSTGGGTSATPTAAGDGCISGKQCGTIAAGYFAAVGVGRANPTVMNGSCSSDSNGNALCGLVYSGYYSAGGGTSATPTASGNGCISGKACGPVAAGYYSEGGAWTPTPELAEDGSDNSGISCAFGYGCGPVDAGYYSTGGGTSATPTAAGNGCISGKQCGKTDAGCYAPDTGSTTSCPKKCFDLANGLYPNSPAGSDSSVDCYTNSNSGAYIESAYDSNWTQCPIGSYKAAHAVNYGSTSTCDVCSAGKYTTSTGSTSSSDCSVSCAYDSGITGASWLQRTWNEVAIGAAMCVPTSCPAGYLYNTTESSCIACSAGYYQPNNGYTGTSCIPADKGYYVPKNGQNSQTPCPAGKYTSTEGQSACTDVNAGYWNNGCGTNATGGVCDSSKYSGGEVTDGCYGSAGATVACPFNCNALTAPSISGGTFSSVSPRNASTQCRYKLANKTDSDCSSITANLVAYNGTAWGNNYYTVLAKAGARVYRTGNTSAPACELCTAGSYQESNNSSATSCKSADAGYYVDGVGAMSQTACPAGTYTDTISQTDCKNAIAGTYTTGCQEANYTACTGTSICAANTYSNARASYCDACNSGYSNSGNTAAAHAGVSSCKITCAPGEWVAAANALCTSVGSGYYTSASQTISQGALGNRSACADLDTSKTDGVYSSVAPYDASTTCRFMQEQQTVPEYCATKSSNMSAYNGNVWAETTYSVTARAGAIIVNNNSASATCSNCDMGTYSTGGSQTTCTPADKGYFVGTTGASSQTKCVIGSYTDTTGQSTCKACAGGKTTSAEGATSCTATCSNATGVSSTGWETPVWNADNTMTNLCAIKAAAGCSAGYYLNANGACAECPSAYPYSAVGATAQTQCYANVTLNKNGFSGTIAAGSGTGCKVAATVTGTNNATLQVFYNTECTLPTISGFTQTGYTTSSAWASGNTIGATTVSKLSASTSKPVATYYVRKTACGADYYKKDATTCSTCSSGTNSKYTKSDADNTGDVNVCYLYPTAKNYVKTPGAGLVACEAGNYCPGSSTTKIYYGGTATDTHLTTGGMNQCPANSYCEAGVSAAAKCSDLANGLYPNSPAGSDSSVDCYTNSNSGAYIKSAYDSNWTQCPIGSYKAAHAVNYGSTSTCDICSAGKYTSTEGQKVCANVNAGYWNNGCGTSATGGVCDSSKYSGGKVNLGYYSTGGGTSPTPTGPGNGCLGGFECGLVDANCYSEMEGSTISCPNKCSDVGNGAYPYSEQGATSENSCYMNVPAGSYMPRAGYYASTFCPLGSYSSAHVAYYGEITSCSLCPAGQTTENVASTSISECSVECDESGNTTVWKTPIWNAGGYVENLCKASTCVNGALYDETLGLCKSCPDNATCDGTSDWTCDTNYTKTETGCELGVFSCTAGQDSNGAKCKAGYYCPGGDVSINMKDSDEFGCMRKCPSDVAGGMVTSGAGSNAITACYAVRVDATLDNETGSGDQTCSYSSDRRDYSESCTIKITKCIAGYYRESEDSITCAVTQVGYYSPKDSIERFDCNALSGANSALTQNTGADSATQCYNICGSISVDNGVQKPTSEKSFYDGSSYPACGYTLICNDGYSANADMCEPDVYEITLNHNGGQSSLSKIYLKYGMGWYSDKSASTKIESISLPTMSAKTCSGYLSSTNDIIVDANGQLTDNYTLFKSNATITASWEQNAQITCNAGTYYPGTGTNCIECTVGNYCTGVTTFQGINQAKGLVACPVKTGNDIAAENRTVAVSSDNGAKSENDCFATNLLYTAKNSTGAQTCYYNSTLGKYSNSCKDVELLSCNAGHYKNTTQNAMDCVEVGVGYYSPATETTRKACPNLADDIGVSTKSTTAASVQQCYLEGMWYEPVNGHSGQRRSCYHISDESETDVFKGYNYNCEVGRVVACHAGYYYDESWAAEGIERDCRPVEKGYYSPAQSYYAISASEAEQPVEPGSSVKRYACPDGGLTSDDTAEFATECFKEKLVCTVANGTGLQTRYYTEKVETDGAGYENANNNVCVVNACDNGYFLNNGQCAQCLQDHYCTNNKQESCPESHPMSDAGNNDIKKCYTDCSGNVGEILEGRDYYGISDTCGITGYNCEIGKWYDHGLQSICVTPYYCPGEGNVLSDAIGCRSECPYNGATLMDSADDITDCHKTYEQDVTYIEGDKTIVKTFDNGTATWDCIWVDDTNHYRDCEIDVKSCVAGYYNQGKSCSQVASGYYSPDGDLEQFKCPEKENYTIESTTDNSGRDSITDCYVDCGSFIPDIEHAINTYVSSGSDMQFYKAGTYPSCEYTVTCATGYTAVNGAAPRCDAKVYTVTLDKNNGTGNVADSVQCTFDQDCNLPSAAGLQRNGYNVVNQWCTTSDGNGKCYTAGQIVSENISANGEAVTLYAKWTPGIYRVKFSAPDATSNSEQPELYLKYATGWYKDSAATQSVTKLSDALPEKVGYIFGGFKVGNIMVSSANGEMLTSASALSSLYVDTTATVVWSKGLTPCQSGYYYPGTGNKCELCLENNYCEGGQYATDAGRAGLNTCPGTGLAPAGSDSITECYQTGLAYTSATGKAQGTQTCYYSSIGYTGPCKDISVKQCAAGYYYTSGTDCVSVGDGYYSHENDLTRQQCPHNGQTGKQNSESAAECFAQVTYSTERAKGTQYCYVDIEQLTENDIQIVYRLNCYGIVINQCAGGYYYLASANTTDCVEVGEDYYSPDMDMKKYPCPNGGKTNGTTNAATAVGICRATVKYPGVTYEGPEVHGEGTQGCYYDGDTRAYTLNCRDIVITKCYAGYYWPRTGGICKDVEDGFYGPVADHNNGGNVTGRLQCPDNGETGIKNAEKITQCYKEQLSCDVDNGTGEQTRYYSESERSYSNTMGNICKVVGCDSGFSISDNMCSNCDEGYYCQDNKEYKCPASHPYSEPGTSDVKSCYRDCAKVGNASQMIGRDYYGIADTCEISACVPGYTFENGICSICPEGAFCEPGAGNEDGQPEYCPSSHPYSDLGATSKRDCYTKCEAHDVKNGYMIPVDSTPLWPNKCEFKGESYTGNPCDIIDGTCVESSCNYNYEMQDGVCVPCARENAITYKQGGNCVVETCSNGYHPKGQACEANIIECVVPNAVNATRKWNEKRNAYEECRIIECEYGYHLVNNVCQPDEQVCEIENGMGVREWDYKRQDWGECIVTHCDPGYTDDPMQTNETWKQCGRCNNMFGANGDLAVSSYVDGCEIAACLYEGEMYTLDNNECLMICDTYSDETGSRRWNKNRKKCERSCNPGFISW